MTKRIILAVTLLCTLLLSLIVGSPTQARTVDLTGFENLSGLDGAQIPMKQSNTWCVAPSGGSYCHSVQKAINIASVSGPLSGLDEALIPLEQTSTITPVWQREYTATLDNKVRASVYSGGLLNARPTFVDIDDDGDQDLFIGGSWGRLAFYRNDGTANNPNWVYITEFYENIRDGNVTPIFVDIDNDGDFDYFSGREDGTLTFYLNTGNSTSPSWTFQSHSYNLIDVGTNSSPYFADIDSDNDYDLFIGNNNGTITFYRNDGTVNSANWTFVTDNYGGIDVGLRSQPALGDIDNDDDLDMLIGEADGNINYYRNDNGNWTLVTNSIDHGGESRPVLVDLDNDSDLDLFIGDYTFDIVFYENQGNVTSPNWFHQTSNYLTLDYGPETHLAFADLDADDDLDLLMGSIYGNIYLVRNDGDKNIPQWTIVGSYADIDVGTASVPAIVDIDNDNDLDLFIGSFTGEIVHYRNDGTADVANWTLVSSNYNSIDVGANSAPTFVDIDNDNDYDLFIGESSGNINYYRNDGTTTTPSWSLVNENYNSISVNGESAPTFVDIDQDNDFDIFVGQNASGHIHYYRNDGTPTNPSWTYVTDTYNDISEGNYSSPIFVDIDNDGDVDLFSGEWGGGVNFWRNIATQPFNLTSHTPADNGRITAQTTNPAATFDKTIDNSSVSKATFTVRGAQTGVYNGAYNTTGSSITLDPTANFKPGEQVMVNVSNGLKATDGATANPYVWQFRAAVSGGSGVFTDSGQSLGTRSTTAVAIADLDGDNDLDVFAVNGGWPFNNQSYTVWLNNGSGSFLTSGQDFGTFISSDVALGDVDNDGDIDAFIVNDTQPSEVWLNNGSGTFVSSGQQIGGNTTMHDIALGDLDGDGDIDAIITTYSGAGNRIWLNDGTGTFTAIQTLSNNNTRSASLGDLDSDGDLDVFFTNKDAPNRVYFNDGTGTFADSGQGYGNANSYEADLGDLDGDGDLDVVVANDGSDSNTIWLNDGGIFTSNGQSLGSSDSRGVILGDFDNDGDLDVFFSNHSNQPNEVWLNSGAGIFTNSGQILGGSNSYGIDLGDLDNDGDLDIYVGNTDNQPNKVYLNENAQIPGEVVETISPDTGGSLRNDDNTISLDIPAGAVETPTPLSFSGQPTPSQTLPPETTLVGPTFVLTAYQNGTPQSNLSLSQPLSMTLTYNEAALSGAEDTLTLYGWDGSQWTTEGLTLLSRDEAANQILFAISVIRTEYVLVVPTETEIPCELPVQTVAIFGRAAGLTNSAYAFTALISPTQASPPLNYSWSPEPQAGQGTAVATYTFTTANTHDIGLTVNHCADTDTPISQAATHQINITTPPEPDPGDPYETDNRCVDATPLTVDAAPQLHTFHAPDDPDWASFATQTGETYIIEARTPPDSTADVALELYNNCDGEATQAQSHNFSPDVRLIFNAPADGDIFLRLNNSAPDRYGQQANYLLSIKKQTTPANGALVLVAGKLKEDDPVQPNIHAVTDAVYQLAKANGCTDDDIFYLAHDATLNGVDAPATFSQLQTALSQAASRVGPDKRLTLFLMDHGNRNKFYLNGREEFLTAAQLDTELSSLESSVPNVELNLLMEACYSGSFLDTEQTLNRNNRLLMASTGAEALAYASPTGAVFADTLLTALGRGDSLQTAFQEATWTASQANPDQTPWLDANNNGIPNESEDQEMAAQRGFACAAPPTVEQWPPAISQMQVKRLSDGNLGLWAEVSDDDQVATVWAEVYPPSYSAPQESESLVQTGVPALPMINSTAADIYSSIYSAQQEGEYRIVFYARDAEGNLARPKEVRFNTNPDASEPDDSVYLPLLLR